MQILSTGNSVTRGLRRLLCALLFAAALSPAVRADPKVREGEVIYPHGAADPKTETTAGRGSGYAGVLVVAALLAGAGGWLVWRNRVASSGIVAGRKLAIAETKSLGNRQYLVIASYEDKKFLLGVCPGRIDLLTSLDGPPPAKIP